MTADDEPRKVIDKSGSLRRQIIVDLVVAVVVGHGNRSLFGHGHISWEEQRSWSSGDEEAFGGSSKYGATEGAKRKAPLEVGPMKD